MMELNILTCGEDFIFFKNKWFMCHQNIRKSFSKRLYEQFCDIEYNYPIYRNNEIQICVNFKETERFFFKLDNLGSK